MTEYFLFSDALVRSTPLILTGLAVALAFRAGILNIGAEGQFLVGAAASTAVGVKWGPLLGAGVIPLALLAGSLAGGMWAGIAAELRRRFHVLEIISTIMLNFVALHLVSFLVRGPLQEPTRIYPQTASIPSAAHLPIIAPGTRLHMGFLLTIVIACALAWLIRYTAAGFRIQATGTGATAAASAGMIDVAKISRRVFLLSGSLAGLAGGIEVSGVTFALYENISPGYGYSAIAVALIAGLSPIGVIVAGIFFGILEIGATALQRDFGIPASTATVIEALLILLVLALNQFRGSNPLQFSRPAVT